ncbi:TPA: DotI/IcmL family type IV secretion protein [Pseudomonas aeruginosa]|nr:DotI/IcmL family type IV secretion protein [Pseudomonas aeruginosa]
MTGRLNALATVILMATAQAEAADDTLHHLPLLEFTQQCVVKAFELNYGSYERQLQNLHLECMTDPAYRDWRSSLQRVGILDQLKNTRAALVLAANAGSGQVIQERVKAVGNLQRYKATVRTPVQIVFNGDTARARIGVVETDVIRVRQNDRPVGYAIHAVRLNIKK